ncbi:MAG: FAD-binding oxidoreductase [Candidatus Acidiferrales bacterium]
MALSEDKFYRARVIERSDFAPGLWKVRIDAGGDFNFVAGQYATLGVQTPEKLIERAYSIVSSPYEKNIEFFVELVPEGELTPLLFNIPVGGELSMRKIAKGRFTLDFKSGHKNHLLLSTVTGVAPYVSYVRTLYKDWKENKFPADIHLYIIQAGSRSWELGYREELEKFAAEAPWLDYVSSISRPWEDLDWKGETGRVEDIVRKYTDRWNLSGADTTGYLCGHPTMIENGLGILQRCGHDKKHLRVEVYWIPGKEAES